MPRGNQPCRLHHKIHHTNQKYYLSFLKKHCPLFSPSPLSRNHNWPSQTNKSLSPVIPTTLCLFIYTLSCRSLSPFPLMKTSVEDSLVGWSSNDLFSSSIAVQCLSFLIRLLGSVWFLCLWQPYGLLWLIGRITATMECSTIPTSLVSSKSNQSHPFSFLGNTYSFSLSLFVEDVTSSAYLLLG